MPVTWEKQIGPCCGLAALRMVGRYAKSWEDADDVLLTCAIDQGFTKDGEMFDIDHMAQLANIVIGLDCKVKNFEKIVQEAHLSGLDQFRKQRKLIILPYDKDVGAGYPDIRGGLSAHYCIISGMAKHAASNRTVYFARHGASSRLIAAEPAKWIESNSQLIKRDVARFKDDSDAINLALRCLEVTL